MLLVRVDLHSGITGSVKRLVTARIDNMTEMGSAEVDDYVAQIIQNSSPGIGQKEIMAEVGVSGYVRSDGPSYLVGGVLQAATRHAVRNNAVFRVQSPSTDWGRLFREHGVTT